MLCRYMVWCLDHLDYKDKLPESFSEEGVEHTIVSEDDLLPGLGCIARHLRVTRALQKNPLTYQLKAHILVLKCKYYLPFLNKNTIPARSVINVLITEPIPDELKSLDALSKQFIQRVKAFQNMQ